MRCEFPVVFGGGGGGRVGGVVFGGGGSQPKRDLSHPRALPTAGIFHARVGFGPNRS